MEMVKQNVIQHKIMNDFFFCILTATKQKVILTYRQILVVDTYEVVIEQHKTFEILYSYVVFCCLANILTKTASVIASSLRNASNLNWGSIWAAKFKFDVHFCLCNLEHSRRFRNFFPSNIIQEVSRYLVKLISYYKFFSNPWTFHTNS